MKQLTDPQYYYYLCYKYEQMLCKQQGVESVWLDTAFYEGLKQWVKDEYNIDNDGTVVLSFKDDRDYTMFMLRLE